MGDESKLEPQTAKFKWDLFFYGPEGYDEHIGIQSDSAADMTASRDGVIKALNDIKAKPKGGPNGPRAATATPATPPFAGAPSGVQKVCPVHGQPMRPNVANATPGVTVLTSKAGKAYTAFWVCTADQNCKER